MRFGSKSLHNLLCSLLVAASSVVGFGCEMFPARPEAAEAGALQAATRSADAARPAGAGRAQVDFSRVVKMFPSADTYVVVVEFSIKGEDLAGREVRAVGVTERFGPAPLPMRKPSSAALAVSQAAPATLKLKAGAAAASGSILTTCEILYPYDWVLHGGANCTLTLHLSGGGDAPELASKRSFRLPPPPPPTLR